MKTFNENEQGRAVGIAAKLKSHHPAAVGEVIIVATNAEHLEVWLKAFCDVTIDRAKFREVVITTNPTEVSTDE